MAKPKKRPSETIDVGPVVVEGTLEYAILNAIPYASPSVPEEPGDD